MDKFVFLQDGTLFANGFNRVVHGERGDYVEFENSHIIPKLLDYFEPNKEDTFYLWKTPVYKCRIIEDINESYVPRTYRNALADITIAFALNYSTSGEICTWKAVQKNNKLYFKGVENNIESIIEAANKFGREVSINIAGNGAYTFNKYHLVQEDINELVFSYLNELHKSIKISLIRSGGQSGADEAGILAGIKLGIPTLVVCPNRYRFRTWDNVEVYDKEIFCNRFLPTDQEVKVYYQLKTVKYADYKIGKYYVSPDQFLNFKDPEKLF